MRERSYIQIMKMVITAIAAFIIGILAIAGSSREVKASENLGDAVITWGDVLHFNGHYDTEFYVDGKLAFCMQAYKEVPDDGQQMVQKYFDNPDVLRALYYGWGGPKQWSGFAGREHGYVTTSRVLSYYYSGPSSLSGGELDQYEAAFVQYLNTKPYIKATGFTPGKVKAEYDKESGMQRTPAITVQGSESVNMKLPKGVVLYNITAGSRHEQSAVVSGGSSIYFEAPADMAHGQAVWNTGSIADNSEYAPVLLETVNGDSTKQQCGRIEYVGKNTQIAEGLSVEWIPLGRIRVQKESTDKRTTEGNTKGFYTYYEAAYQVLDKEGNVTDTIIADKTGAGLSGWLPYGTYRVKESKNPVGYLLDSAEYTVQLDKEEMEIVSGETPQYGQIVLMKADRETGESTHQGAGTLKGAIYEVRDEKGAVTATLTTDEKGMAATENLLFGNYTIREIEAPEGYIVDDKEYTVELESKDRTATIFVEKISVKEQAIRADIELVKIAADTHKRLSEVPFKITSGTSGESHIYKTDKNGYLTTANAEDKFGTGKIEPAAGALLYDTYTIEEQRCKANEGFDLIPPFEITVSKNNSLIKLGTLTNKKPTPESEEPEEPKPVESKPVEAAKTGDEGGMIIPIITLLAAGGISIAVLTMHRRKRRK